MQRALLEELADGDGDREGAPAGSSPPLADLEDHCESEATDLSKDDSADSVQSEELSENGLIEMFEKEKETIEDTFGGEFTAATASQDALGPTALAGKDGEQPLMTQIAEAPLEHS